MKAPSGTRIEITNDIVAHAEDLIRKVIPANDLRLIVSNIGITADFSAMYTANSGPHTATIQVELNADHKTSSFEYMDQVRETTYFGNAGVSTFITVGRIAGRRSESRDCPRRLTCRSADRNLTNTFATAQDLARQYPPSCRRERSFHSAGSGLSVAARECGPHPRKRARV